LMPIDASLAKSDAFTVEISLITQSYAETV